MAGASDPPDTLIVCIEMTEEIEILNGGGDWLANRGVCTGIAQNDACPRGAGEARFLSLSGEGS